MKTQSKAEQVKLINNAWKKISYALSAVRWGRFGDQFLKLNMQEERGYRGGRSVEYEGLSVKLAGKLFAVREIVSFLEGKEIPKIKDYLYYRKSVYFAGALVLNYEGELRSALQGIDFEAVQALDYVSLVK